MKTLVVSPICETERCQTTVFSIEIVYFDRKTRISSYLPRLKVQKLYFVTSTMLDKTLSRSLQTTHQL